MLGVGFHCVADEVLVMEGFFNILSDISEVIVQNFHNMIYLNTNVAR